MNDPIADSLTPEVAKRRQMAALWMDAQPTVMSFILSAVPRIHDAEDLLQQAAVDVATNFELYDPARPFVAWAIGIARNKVRSHLRGRGGDRLVFSEGVMESLATAHAESHGEARAELEALQHCLGRLQEKPRRLLRLRYTEQHQPAEIARQIGSTSGSVRVMLKRVRDQLAECIRDRLSAEGASGVARRSKGGAP